MTRYWHDANLLPEAGVVQWFFDCQGKAEVDQAIFLCHRDCFGNRSESGIKWAVCSFFLEQNPPQDTFAADESVS
jgi:hypothetical protein